MDNEFETREAKEFNIIKTEVLPYLYIALLEYCSDLTGDSIEAIDNKMAHTINGSLTTERDKLNG